MKKIAVLVAALALTSAGSIAFAGPSQGPGGFNQGAYDPVQQNAAFNSQGPSGFNNQAPNTIAGVLDSAYDGQIVVLRGRLTKYLGHDRYEFTDGTGTIEVELDDDQDWSFISKDQLIQIRGEFDNEFMDKKIDVKYAVPIERGPMPGPR